MIWRWLPLKSAAPYWRFWWRATRFGETEVTAKEGAEERDGDEDEAEALFDTAGYPISGLDERKDKRSKDEPCPSDENDFIPCRAHQLRPQIRIRIEDSAYM